MKLVLLWTFRLLLIIALIWLVTAGPVGQCVRNPDEPRSANCKGK